MRSATIVKPGNKNIEKMQAWLAEGKSLNDRDEKDDTFLHRLFNTLQEGWQDIETAHDWEAIEWALANGADPLARNPRGLPGNVFLQRLSRELKAHHFRQELSDPNYKFNVERKLKTKFFDLYKKYQPNYALMVKFLHKDFINAISIEGLSQDCLEKLRNYITAQFEDEQRKFESYERECFERVYNEIEGELQLLEEFPDLAETIDLLCHPQHRTCIFRALLLNAHYFDLFTNLCEQLNDFALGTTRTNTILCLAEEFDKKKTVLEELDAIPTPLTEAEDALTSKIFSKLECALNKRIADQHASKILSREDTNDIKQMLVADLQGARKEIVAQVKGGAQHAKNTGLFAEIARQRKLLESAKYFPERRREKHAAAAEKRLKKLKK